MLYQKIKYISNKNSRIISFCVNGHLKLVLHLYENNVEMSAEDYNFI